MKTIAIDIGHSYISQGAKNHNGMSEFLFNEELAAMIASELKGYPGFNPVIVYREDYAGLPQKINETDADICVSLHCNAFNKKTSGFEVLHWHSSSNGKHLASLILNEIDSVFSINNRGLKPKNKGDRGSEQLLKTKMPCVIVEPFFIDNDTDLMYATNRKSELSKAIVSGIVKYWS